MAQLYLQWFLSISITLNALRSALVQMGRTGAYTRIQIYKYKLMYVYIYIQIYKSKYRYM